jgi:hypothetical protein
MTLALLLFFSDIVIIILHPRHRQENTETCPKHPKKVKLQCQGPDILIVEAESTYRLQDVVMCLIHQGDSGLLSAVINDYLNNDDGKLMVAANISELLADLLKSDQFQTLVTEAVRALLTSKKGAQLITSILQCNTNLNSETSEDSEQQAPLLKPN